MTLAEIASHADIRHGGPRPRRCAGAEEYVVSSTTLVIVEVWWSQLRSSWHQQVWLYESLLMTRTESHGRCTIVEPTATMRVQNYADSRIKHDTCWNCFSCWYRGSVCIICTIVGQHFNFQLIHSIARVSWR